MEIFLKGGERGLKAKKIKLLGIFVKIRLERRNKVTTFAALKMGI